MKAKLNQNSKLLMALTTLLCLSSARSHRSGSVPDLGQGFEFADKITSRLERLEDFDSRALKPENPQAQKADSRFSTPANKSFVASLRALKALLDSAPMLDLLNQQKSPKTTNLASLNLQLQFGYVDDFSRQRLPGQDDQLRDLSGILMRELLDLMKILHEEVKIAFTGYRTNPLPPRLRVLHGVRFDDDDSEDEVDPNDPYHHIRFINPNRRDQFFRFYKARLDRHVLNQQEFRNDLPHAIFDIYWTIFGTAPIYSGELEIEMDNMIALINNLYLRIHDAYFTDGQLTNREGLKAEVDSWYQMIFEVVQN